MSKLLKAVREAFEEPVDGRLEDGSNDEWHARLNSVAQHLKSESHLLDWKEIAAILVKEAGIVQTEGPSAEEMFG